MAKFFAVHQIYDGFSAKLENYEGQSYFWPENCWQIFRVYCSYCLICVVQLSYSWN